MLRLKGYIFRRLGIQECYYQIYMRYKDHSLPELYSVKLTLHEPNVIARPTTYAMSPYSYHIT